MPLLTSRIPELPFPRLHHHPRHSAFRVLFSTTTTTSSSSSENSNSNSKSKTRRYPWDLSSAPPPPSPPWLQRWPSSSPSPSAPKVDVLEKPRPAATQTPVDRIVLRLRNLGIDVSDPKARDSEAAEPDDEVPLGHLLARSWKRPDLAGLDDAEEGLPWEREDGGEAMAVESEGERPRRRTMKAPSLAELTLEDVELRRLRRLGIGLRERLSVPQAGVTQEMVGKIKEVWRKSELVRLKFHEKLAHDMKTAHELVERRTGGLVIWKAGSVMVVYRGSALERSSRPQPVHSEEPSAEASQQLFVPDVSQAADKSAGSSNNTMSMSQESKPSTSFYHDVELTEEEVEFNQLLDGLGPRFIDWWGIGIPPVDGDLLPQEIPGYKPPRRFLPTGMRSRLSNKELTNLRKMARLLPTHFALGRNRHHQGLAAAILKLWEKCIIAKIAVKRGVQNTNNKLMAEELRDLTGGTLLLRNKYYIVIYRGKDFLPTSVAAVLAERQELTKDIQDIEEKSRASVREVLNSKAGTELLVEQPGLQDDIQDQEHNVISNHNEQLHVENNLEYPAAGTLAEFLEAQARWGREITAEEHQQMKKEASRSKVARLVKRIEHKLSLAEAKKYRAETLLAKIEASMVPVGPPDDQETITEEERSVFRKIGLRMKPYLPVGIRGVFDGVIENMHLHWKYREVVKLISKQKTLSFVEDTARLVEYESGGILVAIERVSKGYALIFYRGKNYQRPISIRPRNLLTKAKALQRSVALQRHEALTQHICELEKTIQQYQLELGDDSDASQKNDTSSISHSAEDEESASQYDSDSDSDSDGENDASFMSDDTDGREDDYSGGIY